MITRVIRCGWVLLFLLGGTLLSESAYVREVQEELRKRNLFFGEIDGRETPQLAGALKRYQARKGFEPTGVVDGPTAASLQIPSAVAAAQTASGAATTESAATAAISAPETVRAAETMSASEASTTAEAAAEVVTQTTGRAWADLPVVPEPPAEAPTSDDELTPERVNRFVETYLSDGETDDIGLQVWFYSFPVNYFEHGAVDQDFVVKDTQAYVKRWPERNYKLVGPITFASSGNPGETMIEFTIDYTVRKDERVKSGRTKNFWTVRTDGENMKIIAIREQHVSR